MDNYFRVNTKFNLNISLFSIKARTRSISALRLINSLSNTEMLFRSVFSRIYLEPNIWYLRITQFSPWKYWDSEHHVEWSFRGSIFNLFHVSPNRIAYASEMLTFSLNSSCNLEILFSYLSSSSAFFKVIDSVSYYQLIISFARCSVYDRTIV